tara:strand:- start:5602 stop:6180 length:579 start_codon:yes stop_codon:yes gene_type:complete
VTDPLNIIVPIKGLRTGKSRLAEVLKVDQRVSLNRYLATRTLNLIAIAFPDACVTIVTMDSSLNQLAGLYGASLIKQVSTGLNAGLSEATAALSPSRTVIVAADLPDLNVEDLEQLVLVKEIGIAPDERGNGTNALSLPTPKTIEFQFGYSSCDSHTLEAAKMGYGVEFIRRSGLAFDLDTKEDLSRLEGWP